jgi:hypothetical protein
MPPFLYGVPRSDRAVPLTSYPPVLIGVVPVGAAPPLGRDSAAASGVPGRGKGWGVRPVVAQAEEARTTTIRRTRMRFERIIG